MASDSSETWTDSSGVQTFQEVDKTLYFPEINIGISTWGEAEVFDKSVNDWLQEAIADFAIIRQSDETLAELTTFLASRLDEEFGFDGNTRNPDLHMGFHVAGYNSSSASAPPGMCHVFIEPDMYNFQPQKTLLALPAHIPSVHLRNGMYEEFAIMWPALSGIDLSFRELIAANYKDEIEPPHDPIALKAEWLGNWVKQMCLVIKLAGLREYIGKTVKVLTFNHQGNVRWFHLPETIESKPQA